MFADFSRPTGHGGPAIETGARDHSKSDQRELHHPGGQRADVHEDPEDGLHLHDQADEAHGILAQDQHGNVPGWKHQNGRGETSNNLSIIHVF